MLHPLSGSITGTGRAGYAALFNFIFTVRVLYCFLRREQALLTVGLKNLSHNAVLLFMICFCFDVAAFAVYVQSAIRPVESKLSPAVCHPVRAWLIANAQKKPPVFSDKRKSQQHKLPSVCSFQNARKHTWIQMSTWSGLEKAHINKPFSFISCGHNHPNNISRVICIAGCIA